MSLRKPIVTSGLGATLCALALTGTVPPEDYPPTLAELEPAPVARGLERWLGRHAARPSPFEMEAKRFRAFAEEQDPVTRDFLRLARANETKGRTSARSLELAEKISARLEKKEGDDETAGSPLYPLLQRELLRIDGLEEPQRKRALEALRTAGNGTCAHKQYLFDALTEERLSQEDPETLRKLFQRLDQFRSRRFRKNALRRVLHRIPEQKRAKLEDTLWALAGEYPDLVENNDWLGKRAEKEEKDLTEPAKSFSRAREEARDRRCDTAKGLLQRGLSRDQEGDAQADALVTAKTIGECYSRRGRHARRKYWDGISGELQEVYGFTGWAEAQIRLAYMYWNVDSFTETKDILHGLLEKASAEEDKEVQRRALYMLGRVTENESNIEDAIRYYERFTREFPEAKHHGKAVRSLALLHFDQGQYDKALKPLTELIELESARSLDERSYAALSFGLFWAGRIHLQLGDQERARALWTRLANEFYSTYYGALGHYMLEKVTGKNFALQPARTGEFQMEDLLEAFSPKARRRIHRVEALMRVGLADEAVCEFEEVDMGGDDPDKLALKSLVLHAAGDWLESIKTFHSLPRSYRMALPLGFEKLLYPRRYNESISEFSRQAGVDPDLVRSIIRQESVFNPRARSPVGALGLMQLMPNTARLESRRLSSSYLDAKTRRSLRRKARHSRNLFEPNVNLALGVHHVKTLLAKQKNPVFALTAYNASPHATRKWKRNIPTTDMLSFIEKIPYRETRAYVKLVLRNYFYYNRWYQSPSEPLPHLDSVTSSLVALASNEANAGE